MVFTLYNKLFNFFFVIIFSLNLQIIQNGCNFVSYNKLIPKTFIHVTEGAGKPKAWQFRIVGWPNSTATFIGSKDHTGDTEKQNLKYLIKPFNNDAWKLFF